MGAGVTMGEDLLQRLEAEARTGNGMLDCDQLSFVPAVLQPSARSDVVDQIGRYRLIKNSLLRDGALLDSRSLQEVQAGTEIEVLELARVGERLRGRVGEPAGWL